MSLISHGEIIANNCLMAQQAGCFNGHMERSSPLLKQIDEVYQLWLNKESILRPSTEIKFVARHLAKMVHHVLLIFNPASPTVRVYKTRTGRVGYYVVVMKDVLLAALYLILLLHIFMIATRAVKAIKKLIQCMLVPFSLAWAVVEWILFS